MPLACSPGIVAWVKKKTSPAAITVDSVEALTALQADNECIILAYFSALSVRMVDTFGSVGVGVTQFQTDAATFLYQSFSPDLQLFC